MSLSMNGTWTTGAPMPTARSLFASARIGKKIYCVGGISSLSNHKLKSNALEIYDTENDYWLTAKPMPDLLHIIGTAVIGSKLYCIGGNSVTGVINRIYIYDTMDNEWSVSPYTMPTARGGLRCCYVNGKLYCVGGIVSDSAGLIFTDTLEILDLETGIWTTGNPLPQKLAYGCLHYSDGNLYWLGGLTTGSVSSRKTYIYDIVNDRWSENTEFPLNCFSYTNDMDDKKIYVAGGAIYNNSVISYTDALYAYDMDKDMYITYPSAPTKRQGCGGAIVDNKVYVIGGMDDKTLFNTVGIYSAESQTPPEPGTSKCCCGELDIRLKLPISNNLEVLQELNSLMSKIKGCDNSNN